MIKKISAYTLIITAQEVFDNTEHAAPSAADRRRRGAEREPRAPGQKEDYTCICRCISRLRRSMIFFSRRLM